MKFIGLIAVNQQLLQWFPESKCTDILIESFGFAVTVELDFLLKQSKTKDTGRSILPS